jgi:superfamily II DNA or RNA helicase
MTTLTAESFQPGSLVECRGRNWVVLPSSDSDLLRLKPLGAGDHEEMGIWLPLGGRDRQVVSSDFANKHPIAKEQIGELTTARHLRDAARFAFRNASGPFRCLGKLGVRPRSYQIVPLIMALRQSDDLRTDPVRLLIADDVGIGKTIEALLILAELMERGEVKRFAVLCPPHLCDQWHAELRDKFGIDAVIIRSSTQSRLDREIQGDRSVYHYYPWQIISMDYIKQESRQATFLAQCPDFVIVDEAHTCSSASGVDHAQQKRYELIKALSRKSAQSIVLLTATPHSGKPEQFQSLLGLVREEFETYQSENAEQRKKVARHFVQRRRADIRRFLSEDTPFAQRVPRKIEYHMTEEYRALFDDLHDFLIARLKRRAKEGEGQYLFQMLGVMTLLSGVSSSPQQGMEMLRLRLKEAAGEEGTIADLDSGTEPESMAQAASILQESKWTETEIAHLRVFADRLSKLTAHADAKFEALLRQVKEWHKKGMNPVIFCRFIATAEAVAGQLRDKLGHSEKHPCVQLVTSEKVDEERRELIERMQDWPKAVLVATDCISEGINLQEQFQAVAHYDLPWNPNRIEQREGRVDRYGQSAPTVEVAPVYSPDNPMDARFMDVLYKKVAEIHHGTGVVLSFTDNQSFLQAMLSSVKERRTGQGDLLDEAGIETRRLFQQEMEDGAEKEKASRSRFAQHAIHPEELEQDLKQCDQAIGSPRELCAFVTEVLPRYFGAQVTEVNPMDLRIATINLPAFLREQLPSGDKVQVSFNSPTPKGYQYLGRNHRFVERLCEFLLGQALESQDGKCPARASVLYSKAVVEFTTICLFRVRNVIQSAARAGNILVSEETLLWGYLGDLSAEQFLSQERCEALLRETVPTANRPLSTQWDLLQMQLDELRSPQARNRFEAVALERAESLIEAHERFRKAMDGRTKSGFLPVKPILPMDLLGVYLLSPEGN